MYVFSARRDLRTSPHGDVDAEDDADFTLGSAAQRLDFRLSGLIIRALPPEGCD